MGLDGIHQRLEQRIRDLDHLRGGRVGLLEAHQLGGFLIEVHARHALLRSLRVAQHRLLRTGAALRLVGLQSDRAHVGGNHGGQRLRTVAEHL